LLDNRRLAGDDSGMNIEVLKESLARRPFDRFRVRLSSGDAYDVRHPEGAWLVKGGLYVGLPPSEAIPDRAVFCSLLHIAAIETPATV